MLFSQGRQKVALCGKGLTKGQEKILTKGTLSGIFGVGRSKYENENIDEFPNMVPLHISVSVIQDQIHNECLCTQINIILNRAILNS